MTDRVKVLGYRLAPVVADISQMFCKVSTKGLGRLANARLRDLSTDTGCVHPALLYDLHHQHLQVLGECPVH